MVVSVPYGARHTFLLGDSIHPLSRYWCQSPTGLDIRFYNLTCLAGTIISLVSVPYGARHTFLHGGLHRRTEVFQVSVPYGARHTFLLRHGSSNYLTCRCQSPTGLDIRFYDIKWSERSLGPLVSVPYGARHTFLHTGNHPITKEESSVSPLRGSTYVSTGGM